jgi:hypothetical protein
MKAEVQIHYKISKQKDWRFASIRLNSLSMDSVILIIEKRLKMMHPDEEKKIDYKIIGIS